MRRWKKDLLGCKYENGVWLEKEITEAEPDLTQEVQTALVSLQQFSLMRSLGVEIPVAQQAEAEVKALSNIDIPAADGTFKTGVRAEKDSVVTYNGAKYKCLQTHITQADWAPGLAPALWEAVREEYAEFKQPTGAHNAYNKGDRVTFNGSRYESLIDGNVYSPAAYPAGWKLLA